MDLTEFLLARISEDEQAARTYAGRELLMTRDDGSQPEGIDRVELWSLPGHDWDAARAMWSQANLGHRGSGPLSTIQVEHLLQIGYRRGVNAGAQSFSARVLAECDAKRRIIALHESWPVLVERPVEIYAGPSDIAGLAFRASQQIAWMTQREYRARFGDEPPTAPVLRLLALPYADHPDYRPEWAP